MASTHSPPQPPPQVVNQYNDLLRESQSLANKISELEMDRNEHKLVEETLQPLEPDRRAYRLVGEVLVERTVKEVLPSVKTNRENVSTLCDSENAVCRNTLTWDGSWMKLQPASHSHAGAIFPSLPAAGEHYCDIERKTGRQAKGSCRAEIQV